MIEKKQGQRIYRYLWLTLLLLPLLLIGCGQSVDLDEPPEILYGQDVCDECSMIINEDRFATSYVTESGEIRRFDDAGGMLFYDQKHQEDVRIYWVHDFETKEWIDAEKAVFVLDDDLFTPMGWGLAPFATQKQAEKYISENGGVIADFATLQREIADGNLDPTTLSTSQHDHGDHEDGTEEDSDGS